MWLRWSSSLRLSPMTKPFHLLWRLSPRPACLRPCDPQLCRCCFHATPARTPTSRPPFSRQFYCAFNPHPARPDPVTSAQRDSNRSGIELLISSGERSDPGSGRGVRRRRLRRLSSRPAFAMPPLQWGHQLPRNITQNRLTCNHLLTDRQQTRLSASASLHPRPARMERF